MGLRYRNQFRDFNCFFVTTVCKDHLHLLATDNCKLIITRSLNFIRNKYFIHVLGYVIMPNHIHLILYFEKENKLSDSMRDMKKFTAFEIRREIEKSDPEMFDKLRYRHREQLFKVWNDRFDDVCIEKRELLEIKLDYIHLNPFRHTGICAFILKITGFQVPVFIRIINKLILTLLIIRSFFK